MEHKWSRGKAKMLLGALTRKRVRKMREMNWRTLEGLTAVLDSEESKVLEVK